MTVQSEDEYEDLLSQWSDLESGVGIILGNPDSIQEFGPRVWQYDRWMQALLRHDADVGLYLLFQLATNSFVGYSASHALVSAVLCHLIAVDLKMPPGERDSLVHAALTMNIGMTRLQDQLAEQMERPSSAQQMQIREHASHGAALLARIGITDDLWLGAIELHHDTSTHHDELRHPPSVQRLARILQTVDQYAAMISPRKSREGRSATESAHAVAGSQQGRSGDEVAQALLRAVGLFPPGTFVRLDNDEVAVVKRHGNTPNLPELAIVIGKNELPITPARLHRTTDGSPAIVTGLAAAAVQVRLNHHLILRLGDDSA